MQARATALETKTAALTQTGTPGTFPAPLSITGVNVHIVSGSGYTDDGTQGEIAGAALTGLGNLTLGYNALRVNPASPDVRTGSHNLIVGDQNNYTSYSGLVAGFGNAVTGEYASVSGGESNTASGFEASVSGGHSLTQNAADGWAAGSESPSGFSTNGNFVSHFWGNLTPRSDLTPAQGPTLPC